MDIAGKIAVVTGGGRGLGLALARNLTAAGMRVCVLDVDAAALNALAETDCALALPCDVGNPAEVRAALADCAKTLGCPQLLVNNAGLVRNGPLVNLFTQDTEEQQDAAWDNVIRVNLNGAYYMTRAVVRQMLGARLRGVVVNISSICAAGNPGQGAYSASKAGLEAATTAWAAELGPLGIRVGAVAPGYAATETTLNAVSESVLEGITKRTALKRLATPEEIIQAVRFVVECDFFSGRVLAVDGGLRV